MEKLQQRVKKIKWEVFKINKVGFIKRFSFCLLAILIITSFVFAFAQEQDVDTEEKSAISETGIKGIAAAVTICIGAATGAIAMGVAISKSSESMARQPEAADKIRGSLLLGLVFIETAIIYALVVAIMIIFVL